MRSGDYLFHEGDLADGIYLVLEGRVEIVKVAEKHEKIFNSYQAGDFFGEIAVLDGYGRSTNARRAETSALPRFRVSRCWRR